MQSLQPLVLSHPQATVLEAASDLERLVGLATVRKIAQAILGAKLPQLHAGIESVAGAGATDAAWWTAAKEYIHQQSDGAKVLHKVLELIEKGVSDHFLLECSSPELCGHIASASAVRDAFARNSTHFATTLQQRAAAAALQDLALVATGGQAPQAPAARPASAATSSQQAAAPAQLSALLPQPALRMETAAPQPPLRPQLGVGAAVAPAVPPTDVNPAGAYMAAHLRDNPSFMRPANHLFYGPMGVSLNVLALSGVDAAALHPALAVTVPLGLAAGAAPPPPSSVAARIRDVLGELRAHEAAAAAREAAVRASAMLAMGEGQALGQAENELALQQAAQDLAAKEALLAQSVSQETEVRQQQPQNPQLLQQAQARIREAAAAAGAPKARADELVARYTSLAANGRAIYEAYPHDWSNSGVLGPSGAGLAHAMRMAAHAQGVRLSPEDALGSMDPATGQTLGGLAGADATQQFGWLRAQGAALPDVRQTLQRPQHFSASGGSDLASTAASVLRLSFAGTAPLGPASSSSPVAFVRDMLHLELLDVMSGVLAVARARQYRTLLGLAALHAHVAQHGAADAAATAAPMTSSAARPTPALLLRSQPRTVRDLLLLSAPPPQPAAAPSSSSAASSAPAPSSPLASVPPETSLPLAPSEALESNDPAVHAAWGNTRAEWAVFFAVNRAEVVRLGHMYATQLGMARASGQPLPPPPPVSIPWNLAPGQGVVLFPPVAVGGRQAPAAPPAPVASLDPSADRGAVPSLAVLFRRFLLQTMHRTCRDFFGPVLEQLVKDALAGAIVAAPAPGAYLPAPFSFGGGSAALLPASLRVPDSLQQAVGDTMAFLPDGSVRLPLGVEFHAAVLRSATGPCHVRLGDVEEFLRCQLEGRAPGREVAASTGPTGRVAAAGRNSPPEEAVVQMVRAAADAAAENPSILALLQWLPTNAAAPSSPSFSPPVIRTEQELSSSSSGGGVADAGSMSASPSAAPLSSPASHEAAEAAVAAHLAALSSSSATLLHGDAADASTPPVGGDDSASGAASGRPTKRARVPAKGKARAAEATASEVAEPASASAGAADEPAQRGGGKRKTRPSLAASSAYAPSPKRGAGAKREPKQQRHHLDDESAQSVADGEESRDDGATTLGDVGAATEAGWGFRAPPLGGAAAASAAAAPVSLPPTSVPPTLTLSQLRDKLAAIRRAAPLLGSHPRTRSWLRWGLARGAARSMAATEREAARTRQQQAAAGDAQQASLRQQQR